MLFAFLIFGVCFATIKFDTNYYLGWIYENTPHFECYGGGKYQQTIQFSDSFANIPQIFITHEYFSTYQAQTYTTAGFNFSISDVTLTDFIIHLHCDYDKNLRFKIKWFAVDDQRIQVISEFNLIPPQNRSYYYANVNCNKYFVTLTSFSANGPTDIQLQVFFSPPNIVTVLIPYIQGKSENLKSIGFQLILGIEEALSTSETIFTDQSFDNSVYVPISTDQVELYPLCGLVFDNQHLLELIVRQYSDGQGIRYQIQNWSVDYTPNYHKKVRISKTITKVFSPILSNFLRFSQKLEYRDLPRPMFSIEFVAQQIVFTQSGYQIINKSVANIELVIKCNCIKGKKIKSKFLKCHNCPGKNYHQFEHSCYGAINLLFINSRFIAQADAIKELNIEITNESCKITQVIYNQLQQQIVIVDIQMMDS